MSSETTRNPNGGVGNRRVMEDRPLDPVTLEQVVKGDNVLSARKQVRANKGAPGIDGITIEEFPAYAHENWNGIKTSLLEGTYCPTPVKRVEIPKDNGGTRPLGIPVVTDRVIHRVVKAEESSFLGFTFTRKRLTVSDKSITRFKSELRRLSGRSWGVSMDYRYYKIRTYTQGWMNYFGVAMKYNDVVEFDHWLRRRIRMCYWKQWRRIKTRIGELMRLGVPKDFAIGTGMSRKGYWHLAKTLSTNCGLGNMFLEKQGLTSIRTLWIKIHHPAKAR